MNNFSTSFFRLLSIILLCSYVIFSCEDPSPIDPECSDQNLCPKGFECINDTCGCPPNKYLYYGYCVSLDFPYKFVARGGCECNDSLLWGLGKLPNDTSGYYTRRIHSPEVPISSSGGVPITFIRIMITGYPDNRDSFYVEPYYRFASCPIDSITKTQYAYASGVFTSDSTGYMHLDWHNEGDSLPYRRCTMPFTRIK